MHELLTEWKRKLDCWRKEETTQSTVLMGEGREEQDRAYLKGTVDLAIKKALDDYQKTSKCSLQDILVAVNRYALATKAKLGKEEEEKVQMSVP